MRGNSLDHHATCELALINFLIYTAGLIYVAKWTIPMSEFEHLRRLKDNHRLAIPASYMLAWKVLLFTSICISSVTAPRAIEWIQVYEDVTGQEEEAPADFFENLRSEPKKWTMLQ